MSPAPGTQNASLAMRILSRVPESVAALLLGSLVGCICVSVFDRYVLKGGTGWAGEVTQILFVWLVFVGYAVALKHGVNVSIDIAADRLPQKWKRAAAIFRDLTILIFTLVFTDQSVVTARFAMLERFPTLQISLVWLYLAVTVSGVLMIIWATMNLWHQLRGRNPQKFADTQNMLQ